MHTTFDALSTIAVIAIVTLLVKLILLLQERWKFQKALQSFPEHPRGIPFLGHGKAFSDGAKGMISDFDAIYDNNEKAMQVWMTPFRPGVVVYHPDTIRAVFATAEPKNKDYRFFLPWLGDGLLISTGQKWARNRRLLTPAFHFDILKPYVKVFVGSTIRLVSKWKDECKDRTCSIDVMQDVSLATLDSLMRCVMGVDDDFQRKGRKHPYVSAVYFLTEQVLMRFGSILYRSDFLYNLSSDGRAFYKAARITHDFSEKAISERKKHLEHCDSSKERLMPFLDILIQAKDEDGVGLSDIEIRNEVDTFMFEGHDTTASGLSWIVYNLAIHPEFQERCRKEVDGVMEGKDDSDLEWEDLHKLEYLTHFIKESLRLHPPVVFVGRELKSPIQLLDGRVIPKGATAFTHINGLHRNPNVWKDPLVFDPDRFSKENSASRHSHAFTPFAAGPRNCIGQHFAMSEMKSFTALLLRHFCFSADKTKPVQRKNETVLRSTTGIHVMVVPRGEYI